MIALDCAYRYVDTHQLPDRTRGFSDFSDRMTAYGLCDRLRGIYRLRGIDGLRSIDRLRGVTYKYLSRDIKVRC